MAEYCEQLVLQIHPWYWVSLCVPYGGAVIALAVSIGVFIATIVALERALSLSTDRAVGLWVVVTIPAVLICLFAYLLQ